MYLKPTVVGDGGIDPAAVETLPLGAGLEGKGDSGYVVEVSTNGAGLNHSQNPILDKWTACRTSSLLEWIMCPKEKCC